MRTLFRRLSALAFLLGGLAVVLFSTSSPVFAAQCSNNQTDSTKWYAQGYQCYSAVGAYAKMSIEQPKLASYDIAQGGHSLAEIAVVDTNQYPSQNSLEIGWNVDYGLYHDTKSHLFVFPTFGSPNASCYNSCGFISSNNSISPGMVLTDIGTIDQFGIYYYKGAWWLNYRNTWFGYYPGTLWQNNFVHFTKAEWYGEVASLNSNTCTQMGDGFNGVWDQAAQITDIGFINLNGSQTSANVTPYETDQSRYSLGQRIANSFRYGGSGACPLT